MKLLLFALIGICTLSTDVLASGYGVQQVVVEQRIRQRVRPVRSFRQRFSQRIRVEQVVAPVYAQAVVAPVYTAPIVQHYVVSQQQIVVPQVQAYVAPSCGQAAYAAPLQQQCLGAGCF